MISKSSRYKPFPAYLDGGREDGGWMMDDKETKINGSGEKVNLEQDARRACRELLKSNVIRAKYPTGTRTRSIRLYLEGGRSVIATRRSTPARAALEARVLQELRSQGVLVPKVLAFDGRLLFQEDLGNKRLSTALRSASQAEGEKLLDSALTSLTEVHATAREAGLERFVVTLGEREDWRRAFIAHSQDLGKFLRCRYPIYRSGNSLNVFVSPNRLLSNGTLGHRTPSLSRAAR